MVDCRDARNQSKGGAHASDGTTADRRDSASVWPPATAACYLTTAAPGRWPEQLAVQLRGSRACAGIAPSLVACERLAVEGDVTFGREVVVRGVVTVSGPRQIEDGTVLEG